MIDGLVSRGVAVLAPNARGSSGYGLRFQRLIYGKWDSSVEDFRAAAELLRATPSIDSNRLAVYGVSYGGFAALSCLTRLPEYWRAGVCESGVVDLLDFVRTMPPTWRVRAREWVGDADDVTERERLRDASPVENAEQIEAPLLLVHGSNDARAAIECTDRLHRQLVECGKPVTYDRIDGAGHEIVLDGVDVQSRIVDWLCDALAERGGSSTEERR
jgi:dipeptidyl aminopeptidase/acylaminoacyl peptidase